MAISALKNEKVSEKLTSIDLGWILYYCSDLGHINMAISALKNEKVAEKLCNTRLVYHVKSKHQEKSKKNIRDSF
ncbi:hypothetical protein P618_200778 [Holospora obtusa F1]|uniref:Uncharacterized protein n=1 Tax=Holospora obtusa F1 TaxID=1399147 RepID=W6TEC7_HOLOB|nr:hypothetical protein P618_200778 [Holospora obtusa F1]